MSNRYKSHNVQVEIDVTPDWWIGAQGPTNLKSSNPHIAALISKALLMAVELYPNSVSEIRVSPSRFKILTMIPTDTTNEALCERAGALVERLNALADS